MVTYKDNRSSSEVAKDTVSQILEMRLESLYLVVQLGYQGLQCYSLVCVTQIIQLILIIHYDNLVIIVGYSYTV